MRILVIEDNDTIRSSLAEGLRDKNFAVDTADNGQDGWFLASTNEYDCIILDNILPKKTGQALCRELRAAGNATPVIMLTVQSATMNTIDALEAGADDYLTKPFSFAELIARIRALLRRPPVLQTDILECDDLQLNTLNQRVVRAGQELYLARKEFMLLEYLLRNAGTILSRQKILEHVWEDSADPFSNTIEMHIFMLRKKVDVPFARKLIHTIPGRGYKLDLHK